MISKNNPTYEYRCAICVIGQASSMLSNQRNTQIIARPLVDNIPRGMVGVEGDRCRAILFYIRDTIRKLSIYTDISPLIFLARMGGGTFVSPYDGKRYEYWENLEHKNDATEIEAIDSAMSCLKHVERDILQAIYEIEEHTMADDNYWVGINHEGVEWDAPDKKAVLFLCQGEKHWIPRSQLRDYDDETMIIPRWLADDRDLEPDWEL